MRRAVLAALFLLAAGSARAQVSKVPDYLVGGEPTPVEADSTDVPEAILDFVLTDPLFKSLDDQDCATVAGYAYRGIPHWVYGSDAASLFDFLYYWEDRCGASEPVLRMWILATIWEGAFDESYYDEDIPYYLIERWDPTDKYPNKDLKEDFDSFTVDLADQLLPHQPKDSIEEFFCLFYSGREDEAWALLDSRPLVDSWVRHYRDAETAHLLKKKAFSVLMLTGGGWFPSGNLEFAGNKPTAGLLFGQRGRDCLLRFALDVRIGRTDTPYFVVEEPSYGQTNRFEATYLGVELGRSHNVTDRQVVDLFLGLGVDFIVPFYDEDVSLVGSNFNLGLGYRYFMGRYRDYVLGVDVRHEWLSERNAEPYSMKGQAWSIRVGFGVAFVKDRNRALEGLGH
jgi:hypothetical protein